MAWILSYWVCHTWFSPHADLHIQGSRMRPKHLHLRVTFVKCEQKFCIDSQMASWYFRNIFILSQIYFFNSNSDFSGLLNHAIDSGHKTFNQRTCNTCKWPRLTKKQKLLTIFSLKINRLNQLITKLACLMQHWRKYKPKYWWRFGF